MGLFSRRTSGLTPEDAQLLKQLRKQGADLAEPRHVLHYSYFPSEHAAGRAAEAAGATGWSTAIGEPLPEFPDQWSMRAGRPDVVLSDDVVRDSTDSSGPSRSSTTASTTAGRPPSAEQGRRPPEISP